MRALVIQAPGRCEIVDVGLAELQPGWVLVRPLMVGICGSDIHAYTGEHPFASYPLIPGHEFVGVVEAVAPAGGGLPRVPGRQAPAALSVGSRVVADPAVPCGECYACRSGNYNACENIKVLGAHIAGAMAELVAVRLDCCCLVPTGMPNELAVLAEPISIGLSACKRGSVGPEDYVAVLGAGMIGLSCLLAGRAAGAQCAVIEPLQRRRALARRLGAEICAAPEEAVEILRSWSPWGGPTVVIEATGTAEGIAAAVDLAIPAGRVVVLGFPPERLALEGPAIVRKQLSVLGSRLHAGTIPLALAALASGAIDASAIPLVFRQFEDAPAVFSELARGAIAGKAVILMDSPGRSL